MNNNPKRVVWAQRFLFQDLDNSRNKLEQIQENRKQELVACNALQSELRSGNDVNEFQL